MSTAGKLSSLRPVPRPAPAGILTSRAARYAAGVLAVAAGYYAFAKVGQTVRYTASVSAIWPPAGFGIAALYLWGLRWWPGVFVGELIVNGELLLDHTPLPLGSLVGQQAGNMAEIVVGALLLHRLVGPQTALDRVEQVAGMLVAVGLATAISATVGTASMLAGGVIEGSEVASFWRTWWLGDTSGCLVVLPLMLVWAGNPAAAWRRVRRWEGLLLVAATVVLTAVAFSSGEPVMYMVFPALIWAGLRFGPPGATLALVVAVCIAIGFTARDVGPFSEQPIDHKTLGTQLFILVAALTTLFLSAVVSERSRSATQLAEAKRHEGEQAMEERHRIARDLHDSVSQALFSTVLHTRTAQNALKREGLSESTALGQSLEAIGELTRGAQKEMRALIYELASDVVKQGLGAALHAHASRLATQYGILIHVETPEDGLGLSSRAELQLFSIGREALANVVKHAEADNAWVLVEARDGHVLLEIRDDGRGFDPALHRAGHFGLESMRSRARDVGGLLTITSAPGSGTVVRMETGNETESGSDGG
jgi:signal transduction histidine kinase